MPDQNENITSKNEKKKHDKEQKEEERKFGVFFDDDYNYMQHLKDREVDRDWSELDRFLQDAPNATKSSENQSIGGKSLPQSKREEIKV